ncbi:hypothetical protein IEG05_19640 [Pseudomonas kunmingensis]|uniref:hypothetical protein n=1 Tax=Stutzerimonas kunmingensis TaxID=1211807 RepID=UPI0017466F68|nr:hypothetical protein [Stutzerimonas kunmingensis]MBD3877422.1 hypothetical protein [Stutzerimonas kunmingensis]
MERKAKKTTKLVEEYEARLLARGGRRLSGIRLKPEAADALSFFEERGETATKVINRLLIAAKEQEQ